MGKQSNGVDDLYVTMLTYASTNNQWARPACPLASSSKTKPCQFSSVQLGRFVRTLTIVLFRHTRQTGISALRSQPSKFQRHNLSTATHSRDLQAAPQDFLVSRADNQTYI